MVLKTSSSHEEGCTRRWLLDTKEIKGVDGHVSEVVVEEVDWEKDASTGRMNLIHTGRTETIKAELVLLAMGFTNPVFEGLVQQLGVDLDQRHNIKADEANATSVDKVFTAGDASTGASLVVRCIASGRKAATGIDNYLKQRD
jgi:glutamate synthase (NADPH/NADH) small chain